MSRGLGHNRKGHKGRGVMVPGHYKSLKGGKRIREGEERKDMADLNRVRVKRTKRKKVRGEGLSVGDSATRKERNRD